MIKACEIQIAAQSGGGELVMINQAILGGVAANIEAVTMGMGGNIALVGTVAQARSRNAGYRD